MEMHPAIFLNDRVFFLYGRRNGSVAEKGLDLIFLFKKYASAHMISA